MKETDKPQLSYAELGQIILKNFGAEQVSKGYSITEPEKDLDGVGRAAVEWKDINRDGTLN